MVYYGLPGIGLPVKLLLSYVGQHYVLQVLQVLKGDEGEEGTRRVQRFTLLWENVVQASPGMCGYVIFCNTSSLYSPFFCKDKYVSQL